MELNEPRPNVFVKEHPAKLSGANCKSLFEDDAGRLWLFKPQPLEQTLVDVIAARIARQAGVASPIVYAVDFVWNNQRRQGSIQPFLRGRIRQAELSRQLTELNQAQRESLQRHHVVDWLIANADPHRGQFLVLDDDTIVGIDKSQALRFFPHDRLTWQSNAWPLNTRPPVYIYLYEGHRNGRFTLEANVAIDFAENTTQAITDDWWHACWQPIVSEWNWTRLVYATLNPSRRRVEAVEQVLTLLQERKQRLAADFRELYGFMDTSPLQSTEMPIAVVRTQWKQPPSDENTE